MALQQAPGLGRNFGLEGWADFQSELWQEECERAQQRRRRNLNLPPLLGNRTGSTGGRTSPRQHCCRRLGGGD
jgi:hypothetical protein